MKGLLIFFCVILLLAVSFDSGLGQPSLKVGSLIPFTGRWGSSARECARGMLDAAKWLNQRGGIYGRKLEILLIEDTFQTAETMAAYRKLNEADQILLLHIYSTETALSLLPHIQHDRIPTLVGFLPSHLANPPKYPYAFSIVPTPTDLAKIAMVFISERSGIKVRKPKVVFIGSSDYLDQHFLEEAKAYAKNLGLDIGPDIRLTAPSGDRPTKNDSSFLSALNQYNPDFAYLSLSSKEASSVLREAMTMGLKTKWICNAAAFDENLTAFEGILGVQPIAPFGEDIPGMAGIKEAHQKWHPHDSHTVSYVEGWATVQVVGEALGMSLPEDRLSRERVKGSLESFRGFVLGGLVPPLTITPDDHRPSVESRVFVIKGKKIARYTGFISLEGERKNLK